MFQSKKVSGTLLVAGLAAYAYYRYSKLSKEEKSNLVSDLKNKGQKLYDEYVPEDLKSVFGKKETKENSFESGNNFSF